MFVGVRTHTESNCKAPSITIGAFRASEFHPHVVNSVGIIQSHHSKKSSPVTKKGEPRNEEEEKTVGKTQARVKV